MTSTDWVSDFQTFTIDTTDPHRPAASSKRTTPADAEPQPSDTSARGSTLGPDDPLLESPSRLVDLQTAAAFLSIGRTKLHHLLVAGEIESVHIGRSHLIPLDALEEYVARLRNPQPVTPTRHPEPGGQPTEA